MDQRVGEREHEPSFNETAALELDAMTWGAERALKAMVEYQVESLRFLARRTHCNLEFMRHLRHCAGPQDIATLQQSWVKQCVADYGGRSRTAVRHRLPAVGPATSSPCNHSCTARAAAPGPGTAAAPDTPIATPVSSQARGAVRSTRSVCAALGTGSGKVGPFGCQEP